MFKNMKHLITILAVVYVLTFVVSVPAGAARFYAMCLKVRMLHAYVVVFAPALLAVASTALPDGKARKLVQLCVMGALAAMQLTATARLATGACNQSLSLRRLQPAWQQM